MNSQTFIDEIARQLGELVARTPVADFEKNARALLTSLFAKFNLVTREEFDVQMEILARTREKIDTLETAISRLDPPKNQVGDFLK